jgi:adenine-specific DNA-methyltransferase
MRGSGFLVDVATLKPDSIMAEYVIRLADVLEGLAEIPSGSVDLTVTSPPYNIGKEYEAVRPLNEYLEWCERWMKEIHRVTSPKGAFWLNLGYVEVPERGEAVPLVYMLWNRSAFHLMQEVVWNYGAGVSCKRMFSPRNEKWLWFVKDREQYCFNLDEVRDPDVKYPRQKKNGKLKCNPLGKNPSDVWQIPKVTSGTNRASRERTKHPAQFPLAVVERIMKACSRAGDTVLDPFAGSGTTGVAACLLGRRFIGIEIKQEYCEMAERRIRTLVEAPKQLSLI